MKTWAGIEDLQDKNGILQNEDEAKAEILNDFFTSVFIIENTLHISEVSWQFIGAKLETIVITPDCVHQKLKAIKVTSSPSPDAVPSRVLFEAADAIYAPLTSLFQKSLSSGCLPEDWKLGTVVPIHKKGCKSVPENYRLISLTSVVCKVLEAICICISCICPSVRAQFFQDKRNKTHGRDTRSKTHGRDNYTKQNTWQRQRVTYNKAVTRQDKKQVLKYAGSER